MPQTGQERTTKEQTLKPQPVQPIYLPYHVPLNSEAIQLSDHKSQHDHIVMLILVPSLLSLLVWNSTHVSPPRWCDYNIDVADTLEPLNY